MHKSREMKKALVTGSVGQIGSELTAALRKKYGKDNIVAMGRKTKPSTELLNSGPFEFGDITDKASIHKIVEKHDIDTIYHMAAVLSATGEQNPQLAYNVNLNGLFNILEIAREKEMTRVMAPSSIAVFGPDTPKILAPQNSPLRPSTMYGITKVAGEMLCNYYVKRFGLDVRGLRYPGIISSETLPGGGTTDYAVEIFYEAIKNKRYTCFLKEDSTLPMMYMPDCIRATIMQMEADFSKLKHHADYNLAGLSFSPKELAAEIKKHIPELKVEYKPDFRQQIADSWPKSIDDSSARVEWGWKPEFDLARMTEDVIRKLTPRLSK
jgi:nucleoside-diphosphate-sugar epimerase